MNRPSTLFGTFILFLALSGCLDSSDADDQDLQAPTIEAYRSAATVTPVHFQEVSADTDFIPVAFSVTDEGGISEIVIEAHNGFDGHVHKSFNTFVLLTSRTTIQRADLTDPLRFETSTDDSIGIYLDDRNPSIPDDGLVLAGPYHFSIKAADREGNETSYADNSTYHTMIYLQRDYAPQVLVDGIDRAAGTVNGRVWQNEAEAASSKIVFLWAYLITPDPDNPAEEGDIREEWLWGKSNWPHQHRANTGASLPGGEMIDLADLLSDQEAIREMEGAEQLRLWAEDANGNITVYTYQ